MVEEAQLEIEQPLYGDKPTFTYKTKDGGEPIIFPAHSTIRGEVDGITLREFLWEIYEAELSYNFQVFRYLDRSGATEDMKRRVVRLSDDDLKEFIQDWVNAEDEDPVELPES